MQCMDKIAAQRAMLQIAADAGAQNIEARLELAHRAGADEGMLARMRLAAMSNERDST